MRYRFRSLQQREMLLFRGSRRWAEWSPFAEYSDVTAARWLRAALEWANVELPAPRRNRIPVNASLPTLGVKQVVELLEAFAGCRTVKLKVGGESNWTQDLERIKLVSRQLPGSRLRLDANGSWTVAETVRAVRAVAALGIELDYLEQPVAEIADLLQLRDELAADGLSAAIAVDESLRNNPDQAGLLRQLRPEVVILKAAPLGGIASSLQLQREFPDSRFVVSSALESSIGLQVGLYLAATLTDEPADCGLGTAVLFERDVVANALLPKAGWIDLPPEPLQPDRALTASLRAPAARQRWWRARLERCLELV